jgi:signal transduction histidine kinase
VSVLERLRRHGDRLLAIGLVIVVLVEVAFLGTARSDEPVPAVTGGALVALLAGLALAASVAWRQHAPLVVLGVAIAAALLAAGAPLDAPVGVVVAIVVATYSVGAQTTGRDAWVGAVGVAALVAIAVLRDIGADQDLADLALPTLVVGGPWLAGWSIRSRREREAALELARVEEAVVAVSAERARIARELHDAVAHAIGVIVLQARGARRTLPTDPGAAGDAIDVIEATGTQALAEMRRLVGVLRDHDDRATLAPPPSLRHLDGLLERVRLAGLPVTLEVEGTPVDLPPGIDLSAYRIVQEALTNTLAHAGPATASVRVRYGADRLDLEVADTGVGPARRIADGNGLVGMRERVSLYDGSLETGARPGGGFMITARLPLARASS